MKKSITKTFIGASTKTYMTSYTRNLLCRLKSKDIHRKTYTTIIPVKR